MSKLFNSVLFILVSAIVYSYNGFALSLLWEWFIVTAFNVPAISISTAIGIALIVNFLTAKYKQDSSDTPFLETIVFFFIVGLINPTIVLSIGWIVTLFR